MFRKTVPDDHGAAKRKFPSSISVLSTARSPRSAERRHGRADVLEVCTTRVSDRQLEAGHCYRRSGVVYPHVGHNLAPCKNG